MLAEVGAVAAAMAFASAVYGAGASAVGTWRKSGPLIVSGRRALLATAALTSASVAALCLAFVRHDFSIAYVWQTSSTTTPKLYLLTGLWGGQAGSLLFWSWLTSMFGAAAVLKRWRADAGLMAPFTAVMCGAASFYLFLVVFIVTPFETLPVVPADGNGLNPLLQHPGMAFHPPALYLGLTGLTVPFAFAVAALVSARLDAGWITASRRWTLIGWAFLSIGLTLGGRWAYDVLGWGGYWGWDPVENAALMPWLAATAFLHSVMVQERRGMFRVWNMVLVVLTYSLTVLGTFLTRAGLVSSVHAFAQSAIGPYFLVYLTAVLVGSLVLIYRRLPLLRDTARIESVVSRETAFLANNIFLLGVLFAVFWGTIFPLISEIVVDERATVGPPYFNKIVIPIFGILILLMAIGPLTSWRRTDMRRLARTLVGPAVATLSITAFLWAVGVRQWIAVVGMGITLFALIVTLTEIARGISARRSRGEDALTATLKLFSRQRRRYGGYVVHVGVILLAMGVIGSNVYQSEQEGALAVGDALPVGPYELVYTGARATDSADSAAVAASLEVRKNGELVGRLAPRRVLFRLREEQPQTIPAVLHRPLEDVYTLLVQLDPEGSRVTIKAFVNPLISFVWIGMLILVAGTLIAAWPDATEQRVLDAELARLGVAPATT